MLAGYRRAFDVSDEIPFVFASHSTVASAVAKVEAVTRGITAFRFPRVPYKLLKRW